jgi:hypothetical protein
MQLAQSPPYRIAAEPEAHGQLAHGREALAGLETVGPDEMLDLLDGRIPPTGLGAYLKGAVDVEDGGHAGVEPNQLTAHPDKPKPKSRDTT